MNKLKTFALTLVILLQGLYGMAQMYPSHIIEAGGWNSALAKDAMNNIYTVSYNGSNYAVVKYAPPYITGTPIYSNLSVGPLMSPWGITVTDNGDVFVLNSFATNSGEIIKLTAPGYSPTVLHSGRQFSAITKDANNNLLVVEYNGIQAWQVVRYMAPGYSSGTPLYSGLTIPSSRLSYPWGIVADAANNIYVLDFLETNGGQLIKLTAPAYGATVLGSNKAYTSLAIDAFDNLYTTELVSSSQAHVVRYMAPVQPNQVGRAVFDGLSAYAMAYPWGLSVSSSKEIFVNDGNANPAGRMLRLAPPAVTVLSCARTGASHTSGTSVAYTVQLSDEVNGVTAASFSLTTTGLTGTNITNVTGSGDTYTVTINTGTGDNGTIRLDVNGAGMLPAFSAQTYTQGEIYTIDRVAPTGSFTINNGALLTNNATVRLDITTMDTDPILQMRVSNDNVNWGGLVPVPPAGMHPLSAGDGLKTVYIELRDRAGNINTIQQQITLDATPPVVTITQSPPATSAGTVTFDFTSNEPGSTFTAALDGGTQTAVVPPVQLTGLTTGNHTYSIIATDPAGNSATVNFPWAVDLVAPVVSSVIAPMDGYYRAGLSLAFTVNYNEPVTVVTTGGTPYVEVNIGGNIRRAGYVSNPAPNSLLFSYTVVPGDMDMDGIGITNTLFLNGGTVKDAIGNDGNLTLNGIPPLTNVLVNTSIPSVTLSTTTASPTNAPYTITATFSEAVTGLTLASFSGSGSGFLGNLQTSDNITYTVTATPPAGEGGIFTTLLPGVAVNIGGNPNTASNSISMHYDLIAPSIISVTNVNNGTFNVGDAINIWVSYSENVIVNTAGGTPFIDLIMPSGAYQAQFVSANPNTATFRYIVQGGESAPAGISVGSTIHMNGGTVRDAATNNAATTIPFAVNLPGIIVQGVRPAVTVGTAAVSPVSAPFNVTFDFSEAITGFTADDLLLTNATVTSVTSTNNINFTAVIVPIADGQVSIQLPADKVLNGYSNGNTASNILHVRYDNAVPTVTSVAVPPNGYYNTGDVMTFTVNFSELVNVTGTPSTGLQIGAKAVNASYIAGSGTSALTFAYTVVNGEVDEDGVTPAAQISLNGGTIKDAVNNDAVLTLNNIGNTTGVKVYTAIPSVTLSTPAVNVNAPFTMQVQFSETVTGLSLANFSGTNCTLGNLQTTDQILYTISVTPVADGTVTINLPANVVFNKVNNGNTASNTLSVTYDGTMPVITSVNVPSNGYYKLNDPLNFRVNTSEVIQGAGIPYLEVVIGNITRQATYVSGFGTNVLNFIYVVQDGDMDMDGIAPGVNLTLNGATLRDAAGNNLMLTLQNAGNTSGVFVNTSRPTVTISTTAAARVNASYPLTITFSEAVTGFVSGDLTVTNATASALQTTNNITYTVTVTPAAEGFVTISLPADQAQNIGGNGNRASNTLSNTYDATAPVITAAQSFNVMERDAAGTVIGTATATEALGTLQNWAITNDPTGGAFAISTSGIITVRDAAILNNHVNTTVTLSLTVSDGLNTSTPTGVAVRIVPLNKAPFFDVITDKAICITTTTQTFSVTGATATEAGQTFAFTVSADQPIFDALTIDGAGLISYKLKATATGSTNITVIIKDNGGVVNGGVDAFQRSFALTVNSLPVITITSNKGTNVSKGDVVQLTASGAVTYNWGTATGAVFNARPQANTTYQVTGTNASGCSNTAQINLTTIDDYKVDAVNILTPNGDGINDRWIIRNIDSYPNNELKIFDRTGRIIFQRRNYSNDWDGTMNGRKLPEGTYYYILTIDGSGKTVKGYITIISDQK